MLKRLVSGGVLVLQVLLWGHLLAAPHVADAAGGLREGALTRDVHLGEHLCAAELETADDCAVFTVAHAAVVPERGFAASEVQAFSSRPAAGVRDAVRGLTPLVVAPKGSPPACG